jgi:hypothetical protein
VIFYEDHYWLRITKLSPIFLIISRKRLMLHYFFVFRKKIKNEELKHYGVALSSIAIDLLYGKGA